MVLTHVKMASVLVLLDILEISVTPVTQITMVYQQLVALLVLVQPEAQLNVTLLMVPVLVTQGILVQLVTAVMFPTMMIVQLTCVKVILL